MGAERTWLALATVQALEPYIAARGVSKVARSKRGFIRAYEAAEGHPNTLAVDKYSGQHWRDRRNGFVARHVEQARLAGEPWWKDGEPTGRHLALIAWAYTPTPQRLRAWLRKQHARRGA